MPQPGACVPCAPNGVSRNALWSTPCRTSTRRSSAPSHLRSRPHSSSSSSNPLPRSHRRLWRLPLPLWLTSNLPRMDRLRLAPTSRGEHSDAQATPARAPTSRKGSKHDAGASDGGYGASASGADSSGSGSGSGSVSEEFLKQTGVGRKSKREAEFKSRRWAEAPEEVKGGFEETLRHQWEPDLSEAAVTAFFPKRTGKMECAEPGLDILCKLVG